MSEIQTSEIQTKFRSVFHFGHLLYTSVNQIIGFLLKWSRLSNRIQAFFSRFEQSGNQILSVVTFTFSLRASISAVS